MQAKGVRYVGRVPSVEPFYSASHGVVVPVFEGSGTRLKMLEAMAYGRPVISTSLGAEGLPVVAGEHFLQADDPESFAAAAVRLAGWYLHPEDGQTSRLIANAREAARAVLLAGHHRAARRALPIRARTAGTGPNGGPRPSDREPIPSSRSCQARAVRAAESPFIAEWLGFASGRSSNTNFRLILC